MTTRRAPQQDGLTLAPYAGPSMLGRARASVWRMAVVSSGTVSLLVFVLLTLVCGLSEEAWALNPPEIRAAQWLMTQQNLDGSWGAVDEIKPLYTTNAVLALASVSQRNAAYYRGIAWLDNHALSSVDYRARRVLAFTGTGSDIQADLTYLRAAVAVPATGPSGWGLSPAYADSPLDTALVLQAFGAMGEPTNVSAALTYLKATQLTGATQGWTVAQDPTSDPIITAQVVLALLTYAGTDGTLAMPIANAVTTLQSVVTGTSSPLEQAYAALALLRQNGASPAAQTLLQSLRATQLASGANSGSWGGDVYTTAMATRALATAGGAGLAALGDPVFIPDANLRGAINLALGKNKTDVLTRGDLLQLTQLNASGLGIKDLTGLQWAVNLRTADLRSNAITNISPLAGLTNLASVLLQGNNLSPTTDSDGDGATDEEEAFAGTQPFNAQSYPTFHIVGNTNADVFQLNDPPPGLLSEITETSSPLPWGFYLDEIKDAWHALWEDFDGDGDLDAVVYVDGQSEFWDVICSADCGTYTGPVRGKLYIFENVNGTYVRRTMNPGEDRPTGDVIQLLAFDYDNDGKKDFLMVQSLDLSDAPTNNPTFVGQPRGLVLFKNDGTTAMHFSDVTNAVGLPGAQTTTPYELIYSAGILDTSRDGSMDILTSGYLSTSSGGGQWIQHVLRWNGTTYQDFGATSGLPTNLVAWQIRTVDLNNDGLTDFVARGGGNNWLNVLQNNGNGTFTAITTPTSLSSLNGANITDYIVADYNGDGKPDLILFETVDTTPPYYYWPVPTGSRIRLVKNQSTGTQIDFAPDTAATGFQYSNNVPDYSYGGAAADVDSDGDLDLLITSHGNSPWTTIYLNNTINSDGSGNQFTRLGSTTNIRNNGNISPYFGDLNGDGQVDLLLPAGINAYISSGGAGYKNYLYTNLQKATNGLVISPVGRTTGAGAAGIDAVGTRVDVIAGGLTQSQQVFVEFGRTHMLHFGLGTATSAQVNIYWPNNPTTPMVINVPNVNALPNHQLTVQQP